jgi:hypothetical protein
MSTVYQNLLAYDHAISTALEDQNTLINVSSVLAKNSSTGLDPAAARLTHICVESIATRLGLKETRIVPCLESFDNKYGKAMATQIALEGVTSFIENIFKMIANAFREFAKFLEALWKEIFNKADANKNKDKWQKFKDEVKRKMNSGELKNEDKFIEDHELAAAFYLDGKSDYSTAMAMAINAEHLGDILKQYMTPLEETINAISANMGDLRDDLKQGIIDPRKFLDYLDACQESIEQNIDTFFEGKLNVANADTAKKLKVDIPTNGTVYFTDPLIKGKSIVIVHEKTGQNSLFTPQISIVATGLTSGASISPKLRVANPSKNELSELGDQVQKLEVDLVNMLDPYGAKIKGMLGKMQKASDDLTDPNIYRKLQQSNNLDNIRFIAQELKQINDFINKHAVMFLTYSSREIKASTNILKKYAALSAKAHDMTVNL